ncbi:hypothetical protein [Chryseobacterium sp.]|uniref:hypothetical protein n=1 Tax=Chryseobacterium sp. TaxID=1871047 RepID=UPI00262590CC|nr:hypothetical protein [Chryseobacterium sp.]
MKITIPKPCHENWDGMPPEEKGRFCSVCSRTVHDFTAFSDEELISRFNSDKDLCGRFREDQLGKNLNFSIAGTMALGLLAAGGFITTANAQETKPQEIKITNAITGYIGKVALTNTEYKPQPVRVGAFSSKPAANPLIILDNKQISQEELRMLKPEDIKTVNTLSAEEAILRYGKKGKNGVVEITSEEKKFRKKK